MQKFIAILSALVASIGLYPLSGTVSDVDRSADLVTFRTSTGYLFAFSGADDWEVGDGVSCIMYDGGTAEIFDDIILSVRYFRAN